MSRRVSRPKWHKAFQAMLPTIRRYARTAFKYRDPEARQDLVQEVVANACVAFKALWDRGKQAVAFPSVLARFAIAQVRDHRKVGGKLNIKDVLSPYCQKHKGVIVERLDVFSDEEDGWKEAVVEDTRTATVPDIVAFRCDFPAWLQTLSRRDRRIAKFLALGNRTSDAARKFNVCEGRVSQLRRELAESWRTFIGEGPAAVPA